MLRLSELLKMVTGPGSRRAGIFTCNAVTATGMIRIGR